MPDGPDLAGAAPPDLGAAITALGAQGAHRFDPVRFQFIQVLARRAGRHSGAARQVIDGKLARAVQDCGDRLNQAQRAANCTADPLAHGGLDTAGWAGQAARSPLADLLSHIAQQASADENSALAPAGETRQTLPAELRTLRVFRSTWTTLSVDQQLTDALAKVPDNAGPLNSNLLVLRALKLMKQTSPAYLKHFMAYVDALLWLDQASVAAVPVKKATLRSDGAQKRKPSRPKPT